MCWVVLKVERMKNDRRSNGENGKTVSDQKDKEKKDRMKEQKQQYDQGYCGLEFEEYIGELKDMP